MKDNSTQILAIDCSFIPKSGKSTYGLDYFFNSCVGKAKKGLEISVISVVDVEKHQAYTLSVQQTPPNNSDSTSEVPKSEEKRTSQKKRRTSKKKSRNRRKRKLDALETTRIDLYLTHLKNTKKLVDSHIKYLVGDGYYSKEKFINGVLKLDLHFIGKLRIDANLRYLYTGPQKSRGARRRYDGKVALKNIERLTLVSEITPNVFLYTAVVNHVTLRRNIRIIYILYRSNPQQHSEALLFSTNTELDALSIYSYYKARFQIEFIFRDAKQFTGLCDCQARSIEKLDFHFNASLSALNIAKYEEHRLHNNDEPFVFSMLSYKRQAFTHYLLDTFILKLDLEPTLIKTHPNYPELLSMGSIVA